MKCPRCNFEREELFKFCPRCGTKCFENEEPLNQNFEETLQNTEQPTTQNTVNATFVRRAPYGLTEQTYNEKRGIRKLSRITGGAFLTLSLISAIVANFLFLVLLMCGYSLEKALAIFEDPFFQQYFQITVSSFMFIFPFTLFFKFSGHKISKLINFSLPKTKVWFPIILMGIGFCAFANMATNMAASLFEGLGINYEVDFGENPKGPIGVTLSVIATAIVPALVEEFACRGIVLGALRKYGDGFAVMVSSILFGLIHGNFQQIPFAFLIGLILGFVTVKCESILPAMFIHFYNNLSSVIFDYVFADMAIQLQNVIYTLYLLICLIIGIFAFVFLKNNTEIFKFKPASTEATEKQKYKWFFTTETIILMVIVCIVESLQFFV